MIKSILLVVFSFTYSFAQTSLSLTMSQYYNDDLQSGKRNAFDISANTQYKLFKKIYIFTNDVNTKLNAGMVYEKSDKIAKERFLPNENELFFENVLKYPLNWKLDPYFSFNLRTQLTETIRYSGTKKIKSSKFWDPVNTQESAGLAYMFQDSISKLEIRAGLSLQQIRASKYTTTTDDPATRNVKERYKTKRGMETIMQYNCQINKTTSLNSKLSFFGDMEDLNKWDVRSESELKVVIWKSLGIMFKLNLIYIEKQLKSIQIQQSTKIGFMTTI